MTKGLKLRQVGGSVGATLPKEMVEHFKMAAGDSILAIETERGILLTPYDPANDEAMAIAAKVTRKYRNALRELAK